MKLVNKAQWAIKSLTIASDLVQMLLSDADLNHDDATLMVNASHEEWRLNMTQGVQVTTRQFTPHQLQLKVVAEGEDPLDTGITVLRGGQPMLAVTLREALLKSPHISGQRFMVDRTELKTFQRDRTGSLEKLKAQPKLNPQPRSLPTDIPVELVVEAPRNGEPTSLSVVPNGAPVSLEKKALLIGENPEDLQLVLMALAMSDNLQGLFGMDVFHKVVDFNTGIAHTHIEIMHMLRSLLHREYLEKVGSSPSKYRLNLVKVTAGAEGELPAKKKPARPRLGDGFSEVEAQIVQLEKSVASETKLVEQIAGLQAVITARREVLDNPGKIKHELAESQRLIDVLGRQLAEANVRMGHLQGKKGLLDDGREPLDQALAEEAKLRTKLTQCAGDRERLQELQETLAKLRFLMS